MQELFTLQFIYTHMHFHIYIHARTLNYIHSLMYTRHLYNCSQALRATHDIWRLFRSPKAANKLGWRSQRFTMVNKTSNNLDRPYSLWVSFCICVWRQGERRKKDRYTYMYRVKSRIIRRNVNVEREEKGSTSRTLNAGSQSLALFSIPRRQQLH